MLILKLKWFYLVVHLPGVSNRGHTEEAAEDQPVEYQARCSLLTRALRGADDALS
jgi:hypothetical protein